MCFYFGQVYYVLPSQIISYLFVFKPLQFETRWYDVGPTSQTMDQDRTNIGISFSYLYTDIVFINIPITKKASLYR